MIRRTWCIAAAIGLTILTVAFRVGAEPVQDQAVAEVRALYESAAYGDALDALDRVTASLPPDAPSRLALLRYRALCTLALDRIDDAERAIAELLRHDPAHRPDPADTSPRFTAVLERARARALPERAREQYAAARRSYDAGQFEQAGREFGETLALLDHPAFDEEAHPWAGDIRLLAREFASLSQRPIVTPASPVASSIPAPSPPAAVPPSSAVSPPADAAPARETEPAGSPEGPTPGPAAPPGAAASAPPRSKRPTSAADRTIYTTGDPGVTPPGIVRQELPPWNAAGSTARRFRGRFEGELEVLVDEGGRVESATLVRSIFPAYNALALEAAREWRYTPAMRAGLPVRFRLPVRVSLEIPR